MDATQGTFIFVPVVRAKNIVTRCRVQLNVGPRSAPTIYTSSPSHSGFAPMHMPVDMSMIAAA